MIIFFDVETNGIPLYKEPSDHPNQPRVCQLAALMHDDTGQTVGMIDTLIRPDGWTISPELTKIHGISQERAMDEGKPMTEVLERFLKMVEAADILCGHNVSFDRRMIRIETKKAGLDISCFRTGAENRDPSDKKQFFCTMKESTNLVNLAPTPKMLAAGFKWPKNPKLSETYKFFFDEELEGAHDAMIDMNACARIYYHLQQQKTGV